MSKSGKVLLKPEEKANEIIIEIPKEISAENNPYETNKLKNQQYKVSPDDKRRPKYTVKTIEERKQEKLQAFFKLDERH
jgi:hypothetical protein